MLVSVKKRTRNLLFALNMRKFFLFWRHRNLVQHDILLATYGRSGSTWLRMLMVETLTREECGFELVDKLFPEVGKHLNAPALVGERGRLVKTHESFRQEYEGKKVIFLVRDVRDVLVSYYNYLRWKRELTDETSFQDFVFKLRHHKLASVPFGSWGEHTRTWLNAIDYELVNGVVIRYEDLKTETSETLARILRFCECDVSDNAIEFAVQNNTIERMKEKEQRAESTIFSRRRKDLQFIQKGKSKRWINVIPSDLLQVIERAHGDLLNRLGYK